MPSGPLKSLCYGTIAGDSCVIICIICRCSFLSINIIQTELGFQQNPISAFTVCDTEETLWLYVIILQHSNLNPWCVHMISTLQMHCVLSPFLEQIIWDHFSSYRATGVSENSVPHCTQWFCWSLSLLNGYISLGILTQHFQLYQPIPSIWEPLKSLDLLSIKAFGINRNRNISQGSRDLVAMSSAAYHDLSGQSFILQS